MGEAKPGSVVTAEFSFTGGPPTLLVWNPPTTTPSAQAISANNNNNKDYSGSCGEHEQREHRLTAPGWQAPSLLPLPDL